jgi:hypothetical protein
MDVHFFVAVFNFISPDILSPVNVCQSAYYAFRDGEMQFVCSVTR